MTPLVLAALRLKTTGLHELFYCTVLGSVATVVSLIDSLGEAARK